MNDQPLSGLVRSASGQNPSEKPQGMDPKMSQMMGNSAAPDISSLVRSPQFGPGGKQLSLDHVLSLTHHIRAFNRAFDPILKDEKLGKENIRPRVFEAAAKLMGEKIVNLAQVMNAVKSLPDDPFEQKKWLMNIVRMNDMVKDQVMDQYHATSPDMLDDMQNSQWNPEDHGKHIQSLVDRYA